MAPRKEENWSHSSEYDAGSSSEEARAFIFKLKYNVTVARNENQADMGEL